MQTAHDVKFCRAFSDAFRGTLVHFFQSKRVSPRRIWVSSEGAEFAVGHADVGGIDVAIHIVIGDVAMALFADVVGQPANGQKIRSLERATPSSNVSRSP